MNHLYHLFPVPIRHMPSIHIYPVHFIKGKSPLAINSIVLGENNPVPFLFKRFLMPVNSLLQERCIIFKSIDRFSKFYLTGAETMSRGPYPHPGLSRGGCPQISLSCKDSICHSMVTCVSPFTIRGKNRQSAGCTFTHP